MELPPLPRTLILDYYDSYTNNLLTLFTQLYSDQEVLKKVVVVKADRYSWDEFQSEVLPGIDCIILSPGPGTPDKPSDIGFALDLLRSHPVPILGVCLGHQAIGVAFGGRIINTPAITHGHVVPVAPVKPAIGLFASPIWSSGLKRAGKEESFNVVVYNSLTIDPKSLPDVLEVTAWSVPNDVRPSTIQGLAHKEYPIWGVQYHPESISSTQGSSLLHAFLDVVHAHHLNPATYPPLSSPIKASCAYRVASAVKPARRYPTSEPSSAWPTPPISPSASHGSLAELTAVAGPSRKLKAVERRFGSVGKDLRTQDAFEAIVKSRKGKEKAIGEVWLDGETPTRVTTTSLTAPSFLFTYSLASRTITLHTPNQPPQYLSLEEEETFWDWFSEGQVALSTSSGTSSNAGKGWKGGWVGWFGFEMKQESLQGYLRHHREESAEGQAHEVDACWAWCNWVLERTHEGEWILRGLVDDTLHATQSAEKPETLVDWLDSVGISASLTSAQFEDLAETVISTLSTSLPVSTIQPASAFPRFHPLASGKDYSDRIGQARESIRQGDSYELTLTTQFLSSLPDSSDPYSLYLRLRSFNPAYYSTYMSFPTLRTPRGQGIHVLSSSPERFLRIEKEGEGRMVEMMPIKGTSPRVKPGQCVCAPGKGCEGKDKGSKVCAEEGRRVDKLRGEDLEADLKERAENLMIVDLIRSDLLSCCLPSTVTVPKLIALESYGVHNLVTTVRGMLGENVGSVEAVRRCFPPGSMTGAPKLRSVQLLEGFEDGRRRGIYSGALGYISADGATDLSVVIRTIVVEGDRLIIGAGGAITWLSDPDKEWEEVKTKVQSVVGPLDI